MHHINFLDSEISTRSSENQPRVQQILEGMLKAPLKLAITQSDVHFTEHFTNRLNIYGLSPYSASPENILRDLEQSPERWHGIVYPIARNWQPALDFARSVRRIRERHGEQLQPFVLTLSFVDHLPSTIEWFRRTKGARYLPFTNMEELLRNLGETHKSLIELKCMAASLHFRLVHAGNSYGFGCIPGEKLVAIYASFRHDDESEIVEQRSVLNFLNLLAMHHGRFRSRTEIARLMMTNPFYVSGDATMISASSIKTYIARIEGALRKLWNNSGNPGETTLVAKQARGGKEVAYKLLCTSEIDHI